MHPRFTAMWLLVPALAAAQVPIDVPSARARARGAERPAQTQKLDDALRKVDSDDPTERLEGLDGLGGLPDEAKAVQRLLEAVNDPDMPISIKAINVLGHMRARDATPLLVQELFLRDTTADMKRHVLASLGKIGDPRATSPVVDFLARATDPALKGSAIFALGEIGDRMALPSLEQVGRDVADANLRRLADEAVRKIKEQPAPAIQPAGLQPERRGPQPPPP